MGIWKQTICALALAGAVSAQTSSIVSVFFPDADPGQDLVGSMVAADLAQTTIAFGCATGTPAEDCGFGGGVTLTYGASTFIVTEIYDDTTASLGCAITGMSTGQCVQTLVGPAYELSTDANGDTLTSDAAATTNTQITTLSTTTTLAASDIAFIAVTLTAFPSTGSTSGTFASSGATGGLSTPSATGATATSTNGGTTTSGSHSASSASQTGNTASANHIHLGAATITIFFMGILLL